MAEVQDVLGSLHDDSVMEDWIRGHVPQPARDDELLTIGSMIGVTRYRRQQIRNDWPKMWKDVRSRIKKSWR